MLLKLLPDQISKYWDYIKFSAVNSVPDGTDVNYMMVQNALENLLMDTWTETGKWKRFVSL